MLAPVGCKLFVDFSSTEQILAAASTGFSWWRILALQEWVKQRRLQRWVTAASKRDF